MQTEVQLMPSLDAMTKNAYTFREWLTYYKNIWSRNLIARTIDMRFDVTFKAKDANAETDEQTIDEQGRQRAMMVKERLEKRKMLVEDTVALIAEIDALLALSDEDLVAQWSAENTKVAEDMKPKVEEKAPDEEQKPKAPTSKYKLVSNLGVGAVEGVEGMAGDIVELDPENEHTKNMLRANVIIAVQE